LGAGNDSAFISQVGVVVQPFAVAAAEEGRVFETDPAVPERAFDRAADAFGQVAAIVLDIGENLGHRVAFDVVLDGVSVARAISAIGSIASAVVVVAGLRIEADVDGVGIAEEVVKVTEDLLIGADQEDGQEIGGAIPGV
jgi:hypothetical protein